ncbi:MAG: hypothetical protein HUJ76_02820 [Parasporobacterium sp.]|nr:hypothetical protein [Parasporobacterium sp.]
MSKTIGLITANYVSDEFNISAEERALAAVPFGGRYRLIDFPLSNMANSGINTVGLIVPFNNRSLIEHVGTGKAWGFGRKTHSLFMLPGTVYGKRGDKSKFLLKDIIANLRFFNYDKPDYVLITGSNRIYTMDYRPLIAQHEASGCKITKVFKGDKFMDCFVINTSLINDLVKWFSNVDFLGITSIISEYLPNENVGRYEYVGYEHSINNLKDYYETNCDLLKEEVNAMLFHSPCGTIATNIQDRCPTFIAPTAEIKNSIIAAGCLIEGTVENSVIFRSSHVAENASVKNSVLMQHANIESGAAVNYFVCDKRVTVTSGVAVSGSKESPYFAKKGMTI